MAEQLQILVDRLATPIGELLIVADRAGNLRTIDWTDHEARMRQLLDRQYGKGAYTLAPRAIPAASPGRCAPTSRATSPPSTACRSRPPARRSRRSVWRALRRIRGGKTISYAELARRIGKPRAVRAAGLANGQNPISIVVPCHRVIGSDGSLTGYGGGLPRKKWLLEHEGVRT